MQNDIKERRRLLWDDGENSKYDYVLCPSLLGIFSANLPQPPPNSQIVCMDGIRFSLK